MRTNLKPGPHWNGPFCEGTMADFHKHIMRHAMAVNMDALVAIAKRRSNYRRTENGHHIFGTDDAVEFAIRFPVVTLGSAGPTADHPTSVCTTGPVRERLLYVTCLMMRKDIEDHNIVLQN